jgi:hypothetical protein
MPSVTAEAAPTLVSNWALQSSAKVCGEYCCQGTISQRASGHISKAANTMPVVFVGVQQSFQREIGHHAIPSTSERQTMYPAGPLHHANIFDRTMGGLC